MKICAAETKFETHVAEKEHITKTALSAPLLSSPLYYSRGSPRGLGTAMRLYSWAAPVAVGSGPA
jgi:hypothetical protein